MSGQHTPGPWSEGAEGNLRVYGPDGQGEHSGLIAVVHKGRANVNLIAAAPDLLEALKGIQPHLGAIICYASTCGAHEPNRLAMAVENAIAKARGLS